MGVTLRHGWLSSPSVLSEAAILTQDCFKPTALFHIKAPKNKQKRRAKEVLR
jgi:hypothetical protein